MKILLIFPPQNLEQRYSHKIGNVGGFLPPLGLCSMAAVLEKDNHEVRIMDCPVNDYRINHIIDEVRSFQPEVVGIAAITSLADVTKGISETIKKEFPLITIIVGGPHATIMPEDLAKEKTIDIVMKGEADGKIGEIVKDIEKYKKIKIVDCGKVKELDSIPYPARHLLDMKKYTSLPNNYKISPYIFQMMTTRSCAYTCTYCGSANGLFRQRSVENVIGEIKSLIKTYNVKEIAFWDDIFTMNKKWVLNFCKKLKEENINIVWSCETRLDLINEEIIQAMKEAGCWNIFFGIEAGDEELLQIIKKRTNLDLIRKGVAMVKKHDMEIRGSFMVGLPGETPEKARKTIAFAIELDPDYAQFSITTPYPGTELWNTYEKYGTLDKSFKEYHGWSAVFIPFGYKNKKELLAIHREAFRKFYVRPKYILRRISKIRSWTDIQRNLKGLRMVIGFSS
ncbi:MAG: radical SAM protein [Candidatus Woesearchaeota archaeon]|jgi:radical SAM superfamily enzyme YgiQ (UPF0313 family)